MDSYKDNIHNKKKDNNNNLSNKDIHNMDNNIWVDNKMFLDNLVQHSSLQFYFFLILIKLVPVLFKQF